MRLKAYQVFYTLFLSWGSDHCTSLGYHVFGFWSILLNTNHNHHCSLFITINSSFAALITSCHIAPPPFSFDHFQSDHSLFSILITLLLLLLPLLIHIPNSDWSFSPLFSHSLCLLILQNGPDQPTTVGPDGQPVPVAASAGKGRLWGRILCQRPWHPDAQSTDPQTKRTTQKLGNLTWEK